MAHDYSKLDAILSDPVKRAAGIERVKAEERTRAKAFGINGHAKASVVSVPYEDGDPGPDPDAYGQSADVPLKQAKPSSGKRPPSWKEIAVTAPVLCDKQFAPLKYLIPGMIAEGVNLLVSRPKLGKSWLLLQIGSAVALGRSVLASDKDVPPAQGDVLFLPLEDGLRRVQRRMTKYFGMDKATWPARMTIVPAWRRLDEGGIEDLREWCKSVSIPRLITIDTLAKVRPPGNKSKTSYSVDYEACEQLVQLAHEFPGLTIIIAHHDRKAEADDVFDTVSGTLGLTGGVDAVAILKRTGHGIALHIQGRDMEETVEKAVMLDKETCRWTVLGDASDVLRSEKERNIIEALRGAADGLSVKEIMAQTTIRPRAAVDVLLGRMVGKGDIVRIAAGRYALPPG